MSYSWSGPKDGSPHPMKDKDGNTIGQQSARMDGDALLRHGDVPDGSFESGATMSADGSTMTDEIVAKGKDGGGQQDDGGLPPGCGGEGVERRIISRLKPPYFRRPPRANRSPQRVCEMRNS